ncbi:hypothetical protein OIU83_08150 [Flavobacterium sp. LS1R49]|uniref:Uncharacterized protein n=1 Tax=Flavobacterium shii TaxID=2987687 RepID=A0A9X2YUI6_9FLAO|nr:hypothetical protein [Flavobacterium shii]MCV9927618.1 hypothetical protein [Flavobacterium shii]
MKTKIILLFLAFLSSTLYAQSKADKKIMNKIEKQILDKNIKKEIFNDLDSATITIYLKGNVPILVEKQTGQFRHTYKFTADKRVEQDYQTLINAKFYIRNWKKNIYIRVGKIIKINSEVNSAVPMPADYIFDYNKSQIENVIIK